MTGQNRPTKPLSNPINSIGAGLKTGIGNVQKAVTPAAQAVRGTLNRANTAATSAVTGAGAAVAGAANAAGRKIGQEVEISRRVGAGQPANAPTVAKSPVGPASPSSQYTKQNLGGAQYAAFKGGGGDAAIRQGRSAGEVVAQGRKNISKVVSGREMNVTAPGVVKSSFDIFDVIKGHLIDEGYADTEESALQIMANMSEEWREDILDEGFKRMNRRKIEQQAQRLGGDKATTLRSLANTMDTPEWRKHSTSQARKNRAGGSGSEYRKGKELQARDDAQADIEKYGLH